MNTIHYFTHQAKKNSAFLTLYYLDEHGRRFYVHSRIDPLREKLAYSHQNGIDTILALGFGLGYQWQPKNVPNTVRKVIILCENWNFLEKNLCKIQNILKNTLVSHRWFSSSQDTNITPISTQQSVSSSFSFYKSQSPFTESDYPKNDYLKPDNPESGYQLEIYPLEHYQFLLESKALDITPSSTSLLLFKPVQPIIDLIYPHALTHLKEYLTSNHIAQSTKGHFAFLWHRNFLKNLDQALENHKPLSFLADIAGAKPEEKLKINKFSRSEINGKEKHAEKSQNGPNSNLEIFVAGASPNLSIILAELDSRKITRLINERMLVIAADSAEGILSSHGVSADLIIANDASFYSVNQLEFCQGNALSKHAVRLVNFVLPINIFFQPNTIVYFRQHPLEQFLCQSLRINPLILSGSNAGLSALLLASQMQPSKIWAAGLDFSYPNGVTYGNPSPYYTTFLAKMQRTLSLEGQMLAQLQRMGAFFHQELPTDELKIDTGKKIPKKNNGHYESRILYRRKSLEQSCRDLNLTFPSMISQNQLFFVGLPQAIADRYQLPRCANKDFGDQLQATLTYTKPTIRDLLIIRQLETTSLSHFRNQLAIFNHDPGMQQALFGHWPQNALTKYLHERILRLSANS